MNRIYDRTYNSILIIIDKFLKIIYYIFTRKNFAVKSFTKLIIKKIIRLYGILSIIILNRGVLFIFRF